MLESKSKLLVTSVRKLYKRGAWKNIRRILDKTHVPDIGLLLEELDKSELTSVFQLISSLETKAQVLSYVDTRTQKDVLESLDKTESKKLVSLMESDDAADLLGGLPKELSEEILNSMHKEDSEEVADLMRYPEDSAGGLMSTDFLAFEQSLSVAEAIVKFQEQEEESLISFYVYVIDENDILVGVLSLKTLILSKPHEKLRNIMTTELITVDLDTDQEEVARIVEHYDFLSLPVVNEDNGLEGIITVDDVIDVIREESNEDLKAIARIGGEDESFMGQFRGRAPWLVFSFFGGLLAFILIRSLGGDLIKDDFLFLAGSIPLLLSMGAIAAGQVTVSTVATTGEAGFDAEGLQRTLSELMLAGVFSVLFGVVTYWVFSNVFEIPLIASRVAIILAVQLLVSSILGSTVPVIIKKLRFDPVIASGPLITVVVDLLALVLLLGVGF